MPEGDTLMWTASRLDQALAGKVLRHSDIRVPKFATVDLGGRATVGVRAYGKHLFHRVDGGLTLHTHLKMEGRWSVLGRDEVGAHELRRAAASHATRVILMTDDAAAVGSKLGLVEVISTSDETQILDALGPDVLDEAVPVEALTRNVLAGTGPIAQVLLDQRTIAGLGTFWISEMLYLFRVFPWSEPSALSVGQWNELLTKARRLMLTSATTGIQSSTGSSRTGETKFVHARSGMDCRRCSATIRVAMAGPVGRERTIFYCPACQGGLAPTDDGKPQGVLAQRPRGKRGY